MIERRSSPRVPAPYPARLKGTDVEGRVFREETLLDNLSSHGSYLQLTHKVPEGAIVSLAMRLSTAPVAEKSVLMAAKGLVRRVEEQEDGRYGVAVEFIRRRVF